MPPVAEDVAILLDHDVAEIDPDPQLERLDRFVRSGGDRFLQVDRAADGRQRARELDEKAVSDRLHQPASMGLDSRLDHLPSQIPEANQGAFLILRHQARIAHHVGGKHRCETPLRRLIGRAAHSRSRMSASNGSITLGNIWRRDKCVRGPLAGIGLASVVYDLRRKQAKYFAFLNLFR